MAGKIASPISTLTNKLFPPRETIRLFVRTLNYLNGEILGNGANRKKRHHCYLNVNIATYD